MYGVENGCVVDTTPKSYAEIAGEKLLSSDGVA